jgi:energy-coupling factor transporter ATP-binding protein EcfA2
MPTERLPYRSPARANMEHHESQVSFVGIDFRNYKAFANFSLALQPMNILVGPNNCGKSTIIGAFRLLEIALRRARAKNPELVQGPQGRTLGHRISNENFPISLENVHTDYADVDSTITFRFSNRNRISLYFPETGGDCTLVPYAEQGTLRTAGSFRRAFPVDIAIVPVLGPLEHDEELVTVETVERDLSTHRASRHFRSYWYYFDGFEEFAELVRKTWPGMTVQLPEKLDPLTKKLHMFCLENRISRELYWAGFGFQVWCQMLTHAARAEGASIFIVDEPEIYLHPDVQRQLLAILREIGPDVLLATHSTEIMSEADPSEILVIDKSDHHARRLRDVHGVQTALEQIGSVQNITLTKLARNRRILFVENEHDFAILRQFARQLGLAELASGSDITPVASEGFSSWERVRSMGWGWQKAMGSVLLLGAVFDRDYLCEEEKNEIVEELNKYLSFAWIHQRKEIENYLLVPSVLQRALESSVRDRCSRNGEPMPTMAVVDQLLREITEPMKHPAVGQYIDSRNRFLRSAERHSAVLAGETTEWFESKWSDLNTRLEIVPGAETLSTLRRNLQERHSVTLTDSRIIKSFRPNELSQDLVTLLRRLDDYRKTRLARISG